MRLTPWESDRILIFSAAELARRHRAAGLRLNAPEAIAVMCDTMLEAARAGRTYAEVEAAGLAAVAPGDVLDGIRELVEDVRLEVLLDDGPRLVVLVDPLAPRSGPTGANATAALPGGAAPPGGAATDEAWMLAPAERERIELDVRNTSRRVVRVSSHYPFELVNARLEFDRAAANGFRLDIPAGSSERWAPGETRRVRLVRVASHP
ncbi:MAG TPA: urease subunit gamma [Candidatus Limnocylindrales bacterium]|nr:urease subunit gamma [Candidatus Limnocylindrales bacterium]